METTMTEVDKVFQVAASRIQGLTRQVNHWKDRAKELEAALGTEKAARISAEATRDRALNSWVGQITKPVRDNELQAQAENKRLQAEIADLRGTSDWFDERNRLKYQVIPELEKQRDALMTKLQGMCDEIAQLRADLRTMSERSDGSEREKKAAELEELRAELKSVKQERDCAKDEWDRAEERCRELTEDIEVLRIELRESQKEAVAARQDSVTRADADRVRLAALQAERDELRAQLDTERERHQQTGEYVKNDTGDVRQVRELPSWLSPRPRLLTFRGRIRWLEMVV